MDDFSLHATTSRTFTYCSSYGVDCKLALRKLKKDRIFVLSRRSQMQISIVFGMADLVRLVIVD